MRGESPGHPSSGRGPGLPLRVRLRSSPCLDIAPRIAIHCGYVNDRGTDTGPRRVRTLAGQIGDELDRALAGPVASLLGLDLGGFVRDRIAEQARRLAAELTSVDEGVAAEVALDLACAIHTDDKPDEWWATPLGRLLAVHHEGGGEVGASAAASILGVNRSRVYQLLDGGALTRGVGGEITRTSIYRHLARR